MRLVAKIATGYRGYGLPLSDLISEGNVGMMQAMKHFDPDKGFRLSTYAMWWVKASIQEYILRSWSLVKIGTTAAQKKLFFNLRQEKNRLTGSRDVQLTPALISQIAENLGVKDEEVIQMSVRISSQDLSLNAPIQTAEGSSEWVEWLSDERESQETRLIEEDEIRKRKKLLAQALDHLTERERDILTRRRLQDPPETLEIVASQIGLTRERVRQIEVKAFEKLQKAIKRLSPLTYRSV
jgi:RNA polymerase sigma-32 factor